MNNFIYCKIEKAPENNDKFVKTIGINNRAYVSPRRDGTRVFGGVRIP